MSDDPQMLKAAAEAGYIGAAEYVERAPETAGQRLLSAAQEMRAGLHIAALEAAIAAAKPRRAWHETDQPPPSEPVVELPLSVAKAIVATMRASRIAALEEENARLRAAVEWYGGNARLCRMLGSDGDRGRHELNADGGERARAALEAKP